MSQILTFVADQLGPKVFVLDGGDMTTAEAATVGQNPAKDYTTVFSTVHFAPEPSITE